VNSLAVAGSPERPTYPRDSLDTYHYMQAVLAATGAIRKELNNIRAQRFLDEKQVFYRIDHYLGKDTVQTLFRLAAFKQRKFFRATFWKSQLCGTMYKSLAC